MKLFDLFERVERITVHRPRESEILVYSNPSAAQTRAIMERAPEVRFLIDEDGVMLAWSAMDATHHNVREALGLSRGNPALLCGSLLSRARGALLMLTVFADGPLSDAEEKAAIRAHPAFQAATRGLDVM